MYYYILEPPKNKPAIFQEKIKDILGNLGIAGETVSPSAARTIEELAHLGIMKSYSTIVAVGGENLANKIINVLLTEKAAKDVVLGVIPNDFNSPLAIKIGATDLKTACNNLKERRLEVIDLCEIEPNKYFITEAIIESFRNQKIYFSFGELKGQIRTNKISIKPGLEIRVHDKSLEGTPPSRFLNWLFGKKKADIYSSYFRTKKIRIESENSSLAVKVATDTLAKTPITVYNRPKALKIIVARDKIKVEK